jgi:hypothetical protein
VAGNFAIELRGANTYGPDSWGAITTLGHNLIGNPSGSTGWVDSDLLNVDPKLGPLQDNGGPTMTMALLPGSPAIDAGVPVDGITADQRGVSRTDYGPPDIGAFELQTANNPPALNDAGFEQVDVGAGGFQYGPAGSPWSFSGGAGISADGSGFTAGNPASPEGAQVAFLQDHGSFSQAVSGWAAGTYVMTFDAAQRGNWQASAQDFAVLVDGVVVGTFTPSGTGYQAFTISAFTVSAGSHTITFQGLDSAGGDNTAFVDAVSIKPSNSPSIGDSGFEVPSAGPAGSAGSYLYGPSGSPWSFASGAGVAANGSGFTLGNPASPEGAQVAFLQDHGSFSQAVSGWAAGTYVVTFDAAQRGNWQDSVQDFEVLIDGVVVGTFTPAGTSYQRSATAAFTVSAGSHTIAFQGLDSAGGDNTAFVDNVVIVAS